MSQPDASAWRDLRTRLMSACVLVLVAGLCIGMGGILYDLLILGVMGGMAAEAALLFRLSPRSWRGSVYVLWAIGAGLAAVTAGGRPFRFSAFLPSYSGRSYAR